MKNVLKINIMENGVDVNPTSAVPRAEIKQLNSRICRKNVKHFHFFYGFQLMHEKNLDSHLTNTLKTSVDHFHSTKVGVTFSIVQ